LRGNASVNKFPPEKTEKERKRKLGGRRETLHWGRGIKNISQVLKVPRQCPLVLLVRVIIL
jgi:hypothetical protein